MKMLKSITLALALIGTSLAMAQTWQVGTNTMTLLPNRDTRSVPLWVAGTNAQGTVSRTSGGQVIMALVETTNAPTHADYMIIEELPRQELRVYNASSNVVWLSLESVAQTNSGIYLPANAVFELEHYQGSVHGVSTSTSLVTGIEILDRK